MSNINSNASKIIKELRKRGMEIDLNTDIEDENGCSVFYNKTAGGHSEFVLRWDLEYKYMYVRVNKNQIIAHSVSTDTNMCIWYWQLWLSKKIISQVCDWITSEVWGD